MTSELYRLNSKVRFLLVVRVAEMLRRNVSAVLTYNDMMTMLALSSVGFTSKTVYDQFAGVLTPEFIATAGLEKMHLTLGRIFTRAGYKFGLNDGVATDLKHVYYPCLTPHSACMENSARTDSVLALFFQSMRPGGSLFDKTQKKTVLWFLAEKIYLPPHHPLPRELFHYAFLSPGSPQDTIDRTVIEDELYPHYARNEDVRPNKSEWEGVIKESVFQSDDADVLKKAPENPPTRIKRVRTEGSIQFWDITVAEGGVYLGTTTVVFDAKYNKFIGTKYTPFVDKRPSNIPITDVLTFLSPIIDHLKLETVQVYDARYSCQYPRPHNPAHIVFSSMVGPIYPGSIKHIEIPKYEVVS